MRAVSAAACEHIGREFPVISKGVGVCPDINQRTGAQISLVEAGIVKRFAAAHIAFAVNAHCPQARAAAAEHRAVTRSRKRFIGGVIANVVSRGDIKMLFSTVLFHEVVHIICVKAHIHPVAFRVTHRGAGLQLPGKDGIFQQRLIEFGKQRSVVRAQGAYDRNGDSRS